MFGRQFHDLLGGATTNLRYAQQIARGNTIQLVDLVNAVLRKGTSGGEHEPACPREQLQIDWIALQRFDGFAVIPGKAFDAPHFCDLKKKVRCGFVKRVPLIQIGDNVQISF
jgi:hypothetical protein